MDLSGDTAVTPPVGADLYRDAVPASCQFRVDRAHPRRQRVENFIAQRFFQVHAARITCFMPELLALFDEAGEVLAAVGVRAADCAPLFLEHYLDLPVEQSIADAAGHHPYPQRSRVVEIGNLASIDRSASRRLFTLLAERLSSENFEWAVFTGCSSLQRMFRLLGIETVTLGRALQSRLPVAQQTWGSYYEDNPRVVAGRVSRGRDAFANRPEAAGGMLS